MIHSSFREFLEHRGPLLPDVMLDPQDGIRRLLTGCLQSSIGITLDRQPHDKHLIFALNQWPNLWSSWKPSEGDDPSFLFKLMLAIDLKACFIHTMVYEEDTFPLKFRNLYQPNLILIFYDKPFSIATPLKAGYVLSYLQSSVVAFFLRFLHPYIFCESHQDVHLTGPFIHPVSPFIHITYFFLAEVCQHRPPAFGNIVRALRTLFMHQEGLFNQLEGSVLNLRERSFKKLVILSKNRGDQFLSTKQ